jgi:hypothetical protein
MPSSALNSGGPWRQGGVKCLRLPPRSPNLNALAELCVTIGQRGVAVQADLVRGSFVDKSADAIPRALS